MFAILKKNIYIYQIFACFTYGAGNNRCWSIQKTAPEDIRKE